MTRHDPDADATPEFSAEEPTARCPYCGWPFPTERLCALHVGEVHLASCTEEELTAYEAALDEESDELFVFHLKVIAALVAVFFAFTYTYVFVWA